MGGLFRSANSNESMVKNQLISRGITDKKVIEAFMNVDRASFVPPEFQGHSYEDYPLSIGDGQTISQPYMVAMMTELLEIKGNEKILEIGTGSGYQTAILAELCEEVYTIERIAKLADKAREKLKSLGFGNIHFKVGDGYEGWEDEAPFQRMILTAAPEDVPENLVSQLDLGGKMILPLGPRFSVQKLYVLTKTKDGYDLEDHGGVAFVPMVQK
ncbi:MAG: protein-L-isoaspartate(D-aspartate) O-methyltransferase [Vulcanimicrobiota bacterium]